jgi:vacuolar protein sorting-associated protein 41
VTAVSVSPIPTPSAGVLSGKASKLAAESTPSKSSSTHTSSPATQVTPKKSAALAATASNAIYIATSSVDGHVCVSSLVDHKDVTLRNFARPVQAVALSPDFKNDKTYLSGGLAGNLILTTGGRTGVSTDANTNSAVAAATGWLGSMGLAANTGKDTILHSGEGAICTIKWSLSGRFVVWVNEQGIKIMRSHLHLDSLDPDSAWKRIAHIPKPARRKWDEMAGVWKARADWVEDDSLESDDGHVNGAKESQDTLPTGQAASNLTSSSGINSIKNKSKLIEKLLVGWGDTAWVIQVQVGSRKDTRTKRLGSADIVHM